MIDNLNILNSDTFYAKVEDLVWDLDISYMDAVVLYCEKNDIEIETAAEIIKGNQRIKSAIQLEGEALRCLPRSAKLPI